MYMYDGLINVRIMVQRNKYYVVGVLVLMG